MARDIAVVQTTTTGSGAGVAIERIGTTDYQVVKVAGGQSGATSGVEATTGSPAAAAVGIVARVVDGVVVAVTSTVPVSAVGTVSITTGTVSVSGAVQASGTVSVSGTVPVTGTIFAHPANVTMPVGIFDPILLSQPAGPGAGVPVWLYVDQYVLAAGLTVTGTTLPAATVANARPLHFTTAAPTAAMPAPVVRVVGPVDISPTTFTVNTAGTVNGASVTIQQGASVSAVVSGTVNVGTVATILGTQIVSIAQTSVSVAAIPTVNTVVAVSGVTAVSVVSTIATILGTQIVSIAQTSVSVAAVPTVNTVVTILGTQVVTIAQTSVSVAALPTVNTVVTILGTQIVSIAQTSVSVNVVNTVATIVTQLGTQIVTLATGGSVAALDVGRTQVMIILSATSVGISGTTLAFTVYTGATQVGAGTTAYVVPAGKTLRLLSGAMMARNSVTSSPATARLFVLVSTALPTWTSTVPVALAMAAACSSSSQAVTGNFYGVQDVAAGVTVGIAASIATSGATVDQAVVNGYLFP